MFIICYVKYIFLNCFWNRFFIVVVNEVGEGLEVEFIVIILFLLGMV